MTPHDQHLTDMQILQVNSLLDNIIERFEIAGVPEQVEKLKDVQAKLSEVRK